MRFRRGHFTLTTRRWASGCYGRGHGPREGPWNSDLGLHFSDPALGLQGAHPRTLPWSFTSATRMWPEHRVPGVRMSLHLPGAGLLAMPAHPTDPALSPGPPPGHRGERSSPGDPAFVPGASARKVFHLTVPDLGFPSGSPYQPGVRLALRPRKNFSGGGERTGGARGRRERGEKGRERGGEKGKRGKKGKRGGKGDLPKARFPRPNAPFFTLPARRSRAGGRS